MLGFLLAIVSRFSSFKGRFFRRCVGAVDATDGGLTGEEWRRFKDPHSRGAGAELIDGSRTDTKVCSFQKELAPQNAEGCGLWSPYSLRHGAKRDR